MRQRSLRSEADSGPHKAPPVEPARAQPHADPVVDQNPHAIGSGVGKEVRVVRPGAAEDLDDTSQRRVGACSHIQWRSRYPDGINANHARLT